ncbi:helix-turn-helix domain-containing protein [Paenibacillus jamilae]|nr:helix-turn-helix domain-containing protein [Paenibacillus jamilae]
MNNHQRLVSVGTQMKYSITSGSTETRIFVKFYVEAVCSGMMPIWDRNAFLTLIVLASYMGADGTCYPTQWQIANNLGIKRETAGRSVAALAEYRWKGQSLFNRGFILLYKGDLNLCNLDKSTKYITFP